MATTGPWLAQQLMRDFRLTPAAAAAFAGNLAHESGNFKTLQEVNPVVAGSRGGYGWAQWTGPRRRQFESWSAQNGLNPASQEANYGFLKHELSSTPEGAVLAKLEGVNDPAQATQIVSDTFLRPGIPHMASRQKYTQGILGDLGGYSGMPDGPKGEEVYTPAPDMTMVASTGGAPGSIDPNDLQDPNEKGGLKGLFNALAQFPDASPARMGPMGDARQSAGGLLELLGAGGNPYASFARKQRGILG